MHRYLWFELNTKALGKKFQYQAKGEGLSESKEEKMTFNSVVAQKLNENQETLPFISFASLPRYSGGADGYGKI